MIHCHLILQQKHISENYWKVILYLNKASIQEDDAKYWFIFVKTEYFKQLWRLSRNNHVFTKSSKYMASCVCLQLYHSQGCRCPCQKKQNQENPKTQKLHSTLYCGIPGILKILVIWVDQNLCLLNSSHSTAKSSEIKNMPSETLRKKFSLTNRATISHSCRSRWQACWLFMWKNAGGTEVTSISHRVGALKQQNTQIKLQTSQEDQRSSSQFTIRCAKLSSPKEAVILLVFGHKNKTNNRERKTTV